jgi:hypothetical protein
MMRGMSRPLMALATWLWAQDRALIVLIVLCVAEYSCVYLAGGPTPWQMVYFLFGGE